MLDEFNLERPTPEDYLCYEGGHFAPAHDVAEWMRAAFIVEDSPLANPEHWHLRYATFGVLWTNVPRTQNGLTVAGMAEKFAPQGNKWAMERQKAQMRAWFGQVPDFVLTISAPIWSELRDGQVCALTEHELYHCAQERDAFGSPKFTKEGKPKFAIRGHDVEEFIGVVRRYGSGNAAGATEQLVQAASRPAQITEADIGCICGCGAHL